MPKLVKVTRSQFSTVRNEEYNHIKQRKLTFLFKKMVNLYQGSRNMALGYNYLVKGLERETNLSKVFIKKGLETFVKEGLIFQTEPDMYRLA